MQLRTMQEAAMMLGIHPGTLERRCKRLKIMPKKGSGDGRYRYISDADIQRVQSAYQMHASDEKIPAKRMQSRDALMQRIEELEARIAELEASKRPVSHVARYDGQEAALPLVDDESFISHPRKRAAPRSHSPASPDEGTNWYTGDDGCRYGKESHLLTGGAVGDIAAAHGANRETARKFWHAAMGPDALASKAAALAWMFAHREGLHRCDDATCPCHEVL